MTTKQMWVGIMLVFIFMIMLGKLPTTHANDSVFERKLTNGKYGREIQLCYDNFIGTDWNKSMKYEKRCRVLWTAWTKEILSNQ